MTRKIALDRKSLRLKHFSGLIAVSAIVCGCTLTSVKHQSKSVINFKPFQRAYQNIQNIKISPRAVSSRALERYVALEFKGIRDQLDVDGRVQLPPVVAEIKKPVVQVKKIDVANIKIKIYGEKKDKIEYKTLRVSTIKDSEIDSSELVFHTGFAVNVEKVAVNDGWSKHLDEYSNFENRERGKVATVEIVNKDVLDNVKEKRDCKNRIDC